MQYSRLLSILLLLFASLASCKQIQVELKENLLEGLQISEDSLLLHANEGIVYFQNQPFTGEGIRRYQDGQIATLVSYIAGKKHGESKKWFEDGTLSYEANYLDGKLNGAVQTWWKNGNKRTALHYEKGIANGVQMQWYERGEKFKRIQLLNGKEEGLQQSWRKNGKIYNNYEAKNGRIFGLKRANLCYELENEVVQYDTK